MIFVAIAEKNEYKSTLSEQQKVRDFVMAACLVWNTKYFKDMQKNGIK